jgi:hypothetical protein
MAAPGDRLSALRSRSEDFTGIDFVQVVDKCDQTRLRVYFVTDPRDLRPPFEEVEDEEVLAEPLTPEDFRIYGPRGLAPDVEVISCPPNEGLHWDDDVPAGRRYVEICVAEPGDFTEYRLRIDDERIDRFFNDITFSFKVGCENRLDCAPPLRECPPDTVVDFPVDYLARDFVSFRNALLDFAAQRYPNWQRPIEADVGVMLLETLAALGDELSYLQDRHNREAYLETATERRSLRKKARLLDHEIHDGRMARTLLELTLRPGFTSVEGGSPVWVGGATPIRFELGNGMRDRTENFAVDALWNPGNFTVYNFDDNEECLEIGATELFVRNDAANPENPGGIVFDEDSANLWSDGRLLLLRDRPADPSEADRLHVVRVSDVRLEHDDLFDVDVARIRWRAEDALPFAIPFEELELSGNIVPATVGESRTVRFRLGPLQSADPDNVIEAVEREGPLFSRSTSGLFPRRNPCEELPEEASTRPPIYLLSLPGTDQQGLAFRDDAEDLRRTTPELRVFEVDEDSGDLDEWVFRRTLIGESSDDSVFTIEDGTWRRIVGRWIEGVEIVHRDYALGAGYTVRFGDGEFGRLPRQGARFEVQYRLGAGAAANVPAGAVSALEIPSESSLLSERVVAVRNPLPVVSGVDPESASEIKLLTPEAYKAETFFAVRPEDYGTQAEKLDFVQRAQGSFRWTGSWLSAVTAIDPVDAFEMSAERRSLVEALLNCRRQAGRHVIVRDPKFVNLDLTIGVCVLRNAFPGQVRRRLLDALFGTRGVRPRPGFFDPDNFTFGTPLRRSALEAAVVGVDGVEAVTDISIRVHGATEFRDFSALTFEVADDEVIRVENSALTPERGTVEIVIEGGA